MKREKTAFAIKHAQRENERTMLQLVRDGEKREGVYFPGPLLGSALSNALDRLVERQLVRRVQLSRFRVVAYRTVRA